MPENTKLTSTTHVLIRALVFFKNLTIKEWDVEVEQFMLSFEEARLLIAVSAEYNDLAEANKAKDNDNDNDKAKVKLPES